MTDWLLDTLIWTGALIAIVLVLRRPVARWFGPELAYALWLLPLARLMLPPLILPYAPAAGESPPVEIVPVTATEYAGAITTDIAAPVEPSFTLPWELLLTSAWLAGAALFLFVRWRDYRVMRDRLLRDAVLVAKRVGVRLVETPAVVAPVAFGIRDKVIALPPRFMISGSLEARALAIEHELAHHRGHDLLANWLAQPLLALHWFNPLAWTAWSAMRRDQEAACDARALAGRDPATRAAYARVIAGFAAGDPHAGSIALAAPMACPVLGDKSIIHRLRSLTMADVSPRRRRTGRWTLAAGAALALPLTATVVYAGQDAPPVPPTAPAAPDAPLAADLPAAPDALASPSAPKHIVIVTEHRDGHGKLTGDRATRQMFEKRIEKDGKTIVMRSDKPIDETDLKAKLAEFDEGSWRHALADLPEPPEPPEPPETPDADELRRELRKVIIHNGKHDQFGPTATIMRGCDERTLADASASHESGEGADKRVVRNRVLMCGKANFAKSQALAGVRRARDQIARDAHLAAKIREEIVRSLDESIAKLEREKDAG